MIRSWRALWLIPLLMALVPCPAWSQGSPGLIPGQILTDSLGRLTNQTAPQWNGYFSAKQNYSPTLFALGNLTGAACQFPLFNGMTIGPGMELGNFGAGLTCDASTGTISVSGVTSIVDAAHGGTGVNNGSATLTFGGNVVLPTLTMGGMTSVGQFLVTTAPSRVDQISASTAAAMIGTSAKVTTTGTIALAANTTVLTPTVAADTTFQLPAVISDNAPYTVINDMPPGFSMTLDGNGHDIGSNGLTGLTLVVPGSISVRGSTATGRWEIVR